MSILPRGRDAKMNARKTVLIALFSCLALGIYALEMLISPIVPIPGVKLGLSNVIVLVAMYILGKKEAFCVLMLRILLSFLLFGQVMSFFFSLGGGMMCFLAMSLASGFLDRSQIWAVSMIGAIFHSLGQIIVATETRGRKTARQGAARPRPGARPFRRLWGFRKAAPLYSAS